MSMFPRLRIAPEISAWMTRPFVAATLLLGPVLGSVISLVMVLAALLGVLQYVNSNYKLTGNGQLRLIYMFILVWFAVQALFGLLHGGGGSSAWVEIGENLPFLGFLIFVSGFDLSSKTALRQVIYAASPAAAFAALAAAVFQVQSGMSRVEGMAGNAGPFAVLCLLQYGLCLLTAIETAGRARFLGLAGAIAAGACVALSGMRGLWPCLFVLPAALAILHRDVLRHVSWRAFLAAAFVLLAVFVAASESVERRIQRLGTDIQSLQSGAGDITSLSQHLLIWQAGRSLFLEAPFAGHGLGRNRQLMAARTGEMGNEKISLSHFHNAILTEGVQTGIVGIAALLGMFLSPFFLALRQAASGEGRHGLAVISVTTIIYAFSGTTGIMFGHDLMDAVWIAAISYGSFMVFGQGQHRAAVPGSADADGAGSKL